MPQLNFPSPEGQRIRAAMVKIATSSEIPIEVQRREWEMAASQAPLPADTVIEPFVADGVPGERIYAKGATQETVMLWLHGGGFSTGSCITHRELAARLSAAVALPVLVLDYRLAPEHPFPAPWMTVSKPSVGCCVRATPANTSSSAATRRVAD
ncbi:MAG TPA: alpha/beta hydrolase [Phototrophicaceae bacterium]|nr:alpha/beta hydrolase [Phototrophicaceae bacterium]